MRLSSAGDPMIYRSRYLDRLSFSPLGYRQERRSQPVPRPQPRGEPTRGQTTRELAHLARVGVGAATPSGQLHGQLGERAAYLSSRELREVVGRCEKTIMSGQAQIEDYEAFVICQQELSSRA